MPIFIAALLGGLASAMSSLVGRVILALGFSYVAYTGIEVVFSSYVQNLLGATVGLPPRVYEVFGIIQFGTSVNIITSSIIAAIGIKTTQGVLKKLVLK